MGQHSRSDKVWLSNDPWLASKYGFNLYEVDPHTPPKQSGKADEYHTTGATVLREVPYEEATRTSRAYNAGKTSKPPRSLP